MKGLFRGRREPIYPWEIGEMDKMIFSFYCFIFGNTVPLWFFGGTG
jgi:hypothetical protein